MGLFEWCWIVGLLFNVGFVWDIVDGFVKGCFIGVIVEIGLLIVIVVIINVVVYVIVGGVLSSV